MSLLDKASLIVTPNAYKTSKLYSVVPNTTLGDMNVVRATTATRVNSAGLIESVGVNVPRIDYTNGSCPSLLVEPQRTNLLTYSNDFSNGIWTKQAGTSIVPNNAISPDGLMNATKVISNGSNGIYEAPIAVSTTVNNTKSIYLKGVIGGETVLLLDPWQSINTTTCVLTTEWQRFTLSETQSGGEAGLWVKNIPSTGIYIYGAQLEQGSYATSYIPTVATSVTRNTDAISKTGLGSIFGNTYTVFGEFINQNINSTRLLTLKIPSGGNYDNFITIYQTGTGLTATGNNASSAEQFAISSGSYSLNQKLKFALRCENNNVAFYINGVQIGTDLNCTVPAVTAIFVGNYVDVFGISKVNSTIVFPVALTNTELQSLTTL